MQSHPQQTQGHRFDVLAGHVSREESTQVDCCPLALLTSVEQRSKMLVVSHQFFGQGSHLFRGEILDRQSAWKRRLVGGYIDHESHWILPPGTSFLSVYSKKSRCNTRDLPKPLPACRVRA